MACSAGYQNEMMRSLCIISTISLQALFFKRFLFKGLFLKALRACDWSQNDRRPFHSISLNGKLIAAAADICDI